MRPDDYSDVFRDRQGEPCGIDRFEQIARDENLRHIGADIVASSRGLLYVSTIWTGVDMSLFSRRPLIFETMTCDRSGKYLDEYSGRWETLLAATIMHRRIVEKAAQSWWSNLGGLA